MIHHLLRKINRGFENDGIFIGLSYLVNYYSGDAANLKIWLKCDYYRGEYKNKEKYYWQECDRWRVGQQCDYRWIK